MISRKRIVLVTVLLILVSIPMVMAWGLYMMDSDIVSELRVLNPEGDNGTALMVYHPGLGDFQYKVTFAFAEGLVSSGWRVEITTASPQTPLNLSSYDLLVLGWPTYWWSGFKPAPSIQRYLSRIGNLEHKSAVLICTKTFSTEAEFSTEGPAFSMEEKLIRAANGSIVKSLTLFSMAPNEGDPVETATQAGKEVAQFFRALALVQGPSLSVIPPGPLVTDKIKMEIRLTVRNSEKAKQAFHVSIYWDTVEADHLISTESVTVPPKAFALVRAWWRTAGHVGKHTLLFQVENRTGIVGEGGWPLEVISSETSALPLLQAGWFDPGALMGCYPMAREPVEQDVRNKIDAMRRIGMNVAIVTYVEYHMYPYYPSEVFKYPPRLTFDVIEAVLSQADQNGMHVFLGIGRGSDWLLLWDGLSDSLRMQRAVDLSSRVATELWQRYHHHPSFYGWYFTHEMNDLPRASAYYDPLADVCHAFAPDKPVMVAPSGNPIFSPQILKNSHVDIFAPIDCVGPGYKDHKYTLNPEIRIADLPEVYGHFREMFEGTGKHLWTDLEIWRFNKTEDAPTIPAPFDQVKRQIEIESRYVEMLTAYEFFGMMEAPESTLMLGGEEAVHLYKEYENYYKLLISNLKSTKP